jgi:aminoglycoside phosphotransferase (APT) family kinase protein
MMGVMEILGRGRQATVFAGADGTAIKVFEPWVDEAAARREAEVCDAVFLSGAPAPRIDGVAQMNGRWTIQFERLPGPAMIDEFFASDDPLAVARDLGELAARIHTIDGSDFTEVRDQWLGRTHLPEIPSVEAMIRATAPTLPDGTSLLHTDLHPFNVMRNHDGDWIAIDWDGAACGDPAADLCRMLFLVVEADGPDEPSDPGLAGLRAAAGAACLAAYRETARAVDDSHIAVWRPIMLAARLGEDIPHERQPLLDALRAM